MKKLVSAIVNYDDDDNNNNDDDSNNDKVINFVIRFDKLNILLQKDSKADVLSVSPQSEF